jgi:glycosyltransferase involved in cell wall biosynthesis
VSPDAGATDQARAPILVHTSALLPQKTGNAGDVCLQKPVLSRCRFFSQPCVDTLYHGLPDNLLTPQVPMEPAYLAFLGRISAEKRVDLAIEIAARAGLPLKIAAKVDRAVEAYFADVIQPLLARPHVEFIGEINDVQKAGFLSGARALFPIDWSEPFCLVMIEAMACGTPVIAFNRGSMPEVIAHRVTGYIVEDVSGEVDAVTRLDALSRTDIRAAFMRRFTSMTMAQHYVDIYTSLARTEGPPNATSGRRGLTGPRNTWSHAHT